MRLIVVNRFRFAVAALANDDGAEVLEFLRDVPADMRGSAAGMLALFERYAEGGRQRLPTSTFHEASRKDGVWQFIKGRLRVYCFIDDGSLVILTHGSVKKTQKADRGEVARAARCKQQYLAAKARGEVRHEEWSND